MESREDTIRVKEEPNDDSPDAGGDCDFDSLDSSEAKNLETLSFYKSSANHMNEVMTSQEKLDEKIFIEIEFKHVKLELECSSTNICKTEYQSCLTIVKTENGNQTNDMNENIFNEFPVHNSSKPFDFDICHKSFGGKSNRSSRMNAVHNRSKPYECEICHKFFGYKENLKKHVNVVGMFRNRPDLLLDANPFVLLPPSPPAEPLRVPRPRVIPPYQRPQERQE
ncbi:zinc finger protein 177-like [Trichogramma pretiosum]|uniref:zinc finger protein 177-like n=1 Tax=Trichogramma pretiosum TaxID=7493 RepID=UPI000C71B1A4|nr:zinc finger protein 177-like [Trichogramma pretiosum]